MSLALGASVRVLLRRIAGFIVQLPVGSVAFANKCVVDACDPQSLHEIGYVVCSLCAHV